MKKLMFILMALVISLSSFAKTPEVTKQEKKSTITKVFNIAVKTVKSCVQSYNSTTGEVVLNDDVIMNLASAAGLQEFSYSKLIKFNFKGNRFVVSYKNEELFSGKVREKDANDIKRLILN